MPRAAEHHARAVQRLRLARDIGDAGTLRGALREPRLREPAARFLGELRDVESAPALLQLLGAADAGVRAAAAQALGEIGAAEATPALVALLEDPAARVRRSAASALAAAGEVGAAEAIRAAAERDSRLRRRGYRRALRALETRGEPHTPRPGG